MTRPIIGILGNILETESSSGRTIRRSFTNDTCVRAVVDGGGIPMILPFVEDPALMDPLFALCEGMLFPGGGDVDPSFYGEEPHGCLSGVDRAMDELWFRAARHAMEHRIPMLGICRGMQLLNVAFGGSLYQDIAEREGESFVHSQQAFRHITTQTVQTEPGTRLDHLLVKGTLPINSMHHQAVKDLGAGLVVSARTGDGLIEGIESTDGLMLAVQWHPEDLIESVPMMRGLFRDLVERASAQGLP